MPETRDIRLASARALIARAVDKAEQLGLRGGIAVVGATGALVSTSRMDRGGAGGMARARSKAWISGTQQIPSAEHLHRMNFVSPPVEKGFVLCSPEAAFPGAGGMPVFEGDEVVGGIAASGATVSPFFPDGIEQERMIADGRPANPEDLLIHYALNLPYVGQHGDDVERWGRSFGPFPDDPPRGLGLAEAPPASQQAELAAAIRLADAVLEEAARRDVLVSVAVVDRRGDPIQHDAADGAPAAAAFFAPALAAAAATFESPSEAVGERYSETTLARLLPYAVATTAGGVPWTVDGRVVGGLGVAGPDPVLAGEIARAVFEAGRR
jgi:uncharacterized protein GlcG (DUF336 family)